MTTLSMAVSDSLTITRRNLIKVKRVPDLLVFATLSPIMFVLLFRYVFGGAIRVSTPFLFVSLGECITERSGRINLGLEGTLVMGAMSAYGISYLTGSPWAGVLAAGITGALLGALHAGICSLPRVNEWSGVGRFEIVHRRLARRVDAERHHVVA